jgi:hypothetical protein
MRQRTVDQAARAVEQAVAEAAESWDRHEDERGMVGDLVGTLQRRLDRELRGSGVRAEVRSTTLGQEMAGGADLEIRATDETSFVTKRIVLQAKREDKLIGGKPSARKEVRTRLGRQILKMRVDAPGASGVLILRHREPTVHRNPTRSNIAVARLIAGAEPLRTSVGDLVGCRWGQVVNNADLELLEAVGRRSEELGLEVVRHLILTLTLPRGVLNLGSRPVDLLSWAWRSSTS